VGPAQIPRKREDPLRRMPVCTGMNLPSQKNSKSVGWPATRNLVAKRVSDHGVKSKESAACNILFIDGANFGMSRR
jgi:hypothetical protein